MNESSARILFDAIRAALQNETIDVDDPRLSNASYLEQALRLAAQHDLTHLLIQGLSQAAIDRFFSEKAKQTPLMAAFRYQQSNYELLRICEILANNQIPYMPLKGSVVRDYYPEPWMRTSCDIDVLVRHEDLSRAVSCLVDALNYEMRGQYTHDVSLFSQSKVHIELHFNLIEDSVSPASARILSNVWESACPLQNSPYHLGMSDEMLYFYHIAHMAKHFENGGCGIRPFIDLWLLDHLEGADHAKRDALLLQGELLTFANVARRLSRVWFEDAAMDVLSLQMEDYILRGGVYGNIENRILVQQQKKGGRIRYALSKLFIPYDVIKYHYPILQKHRWLVPVMQVRRWGRLIFCGHFKRTARELKYNNSISGVDADNTQRFLRDIGLQSNVSEAHLN